MQNRTDYFMLTLAHHQILVLHKECRKVYDTIQNS